MSWRSGSTVFTGFLRSSGAAFPFLSRVSSYANGSSIARYRESELEALRGLKLHTLYVGLETGMQQLLDRVGKTSGWRRWSNRSAGCSRADSGASVMVLLGLGGRRYGAEHAARTAEALNAMQPRLLSALRFVPVLGSPYPEFELLSERETAAELLAMVEGLSLERTVFRANHNSNPLPLEARFPAGREALILELKNALASGRLDASGPGILPANCRVFSALFCYFRDVFLTHSLEKHLLCATVKKRETEKFRMRFQ